MAPAVEGLAREGGGVPPARALRLILGAHLAALVWLHFALPQLADEAYYAWWGRAPALGYLDHPPAVMAWGWVG